MNGQLSIPLIDFSPFLATNASSSDRLKVAQNLISACHTSGFAYIKNHGISPENVKATFAAAKQFHDLPEEDKMRVKVTDSKSHQGYSWPGREQASKQDGGKYYNGVKDPENQMAINEHFMIGSEEQAEWPNHWPKESTLPGFRAQVVAFYDQAWHTATELLRAIALGIKLDDEEALVELHEKKSCKLNLRHYPPLDMAKVEALGIPRLAAHRDFTPSITLLFQDECGGLEVERPGTKGEYVPVTPIEGTVVMNIGDVLMHWSNDYLKSTIHRVNFPPDKSKYNNNMTPHRYSIPFFVHPKEDTILECFPSFCDSSNPPKYKSITYKEYVQGEGDGLYNNTEE